jgi:heme/copper-type cytochrome/quinol oxidase subunit 2
MPIVLILVIFAVVVLVLILLAVVVVAIRQEPRDAEMNNVAPSLIAVVVRRLLGVYLRRPTPPAESHKERPTTWTETTSRPSGGRR